MELHLRPYQPEDENAIMQLCQLNIPAFFAPQEQIDLRKYLREEREAYFVVEAEGRQLIGAGGINYLAAEAMAKISWDLIHPEWQGKGIGTRLLQHRLDLIRLRKDMEWVRVRTAQMSYLFYQKNGFMLRYMEKDYWAQGYDLYDMFLRN